MQCLQGALGRENCVDGNTGEDDDQQVSAAQRLAVINHLLIITLTQACGCTPAERSQYREMHLFRMLAQQDVVNQAVLERGDRAFDLLSGIKRVDPPDQKRQDPEQQAVGGDQAQQHQ